MSKKDWGGDDAGYNAWMDRQHEAYQKLRELTAQLREYAGLADVDWDPGDTGQDFESNFKRPMEQLLNQIPALQREIWEINRQRPEKSMGAPALGAHKVYG